MLEEILRVEKSLRWPIWCKQTRVRPDRIDWYFAEQSSPAQITLGQELSVRATGQAQPKTNGTPTPDDKIMEASSA